MHGVSVNIAPGGLLIEAPGVDAATGDVVEFHLTTRTTTTASSPARPPSSGTVTAFSPSP